MSTIYKNITGSTAQELYSINNLTDGPTVGSQYSPTDLKNLRIKTINLANVHATDKVSVDLYLSRTYKTTGRTSSHYDSQNTADSTDTYYIFKGLVLPIGAALQLEGKDLYIDYENIIYDIYIKLSASDSAVDVIINS